MTLQEATQAIADLDAFLVRGVLAGRGLASIVKQAYHIQAGELEPLSARPPDLRSTGIGTMSGVYFFVRPSGEIAYIGKATKNNLHREIWGKLNTPGPEGWGALTYPKTSWASMAIGDELRDELVSGKLAVAALAVEPNELSSLCEVYFHTLCQIEGRLPALNSQIG
jgi:hypothetical protein